MISRKYSKYLLRVKAVKLINPPPLSRNQLSYLPSFVCLLQQLKCPVAHNNRLVSLPEEIGDMHTLIELDLSCKEIAHLPLQI